MASRREIKNIAYQCARVGTRVTISQTLIHLIGPGGVAVSTANGGLTCANLAYCPLETERAPGASIEMEKCDYVQATRR